MKIDFKERLAIHREACAVERALAKVTTIRPEVTASIRKRADTLLRCAQRSDFFGGHLERIDASIEALRERGERGYLDGRRLSRLRRRLRALQGQLPANEAQSRQACAELSQIAEALRAEIDSRI